MYSCEAAPPNSFKFNPCGPVAVRQLFTGYSTGTDHGTDSIFHYSKLCLYGLKRYGSCVWAMALIHLGFHYYYKVFRLGMCMLGLLAANAFM